METYDNLSKLYIYHEEGYLISTITGKQVGRPNTEGYIRIRSSNGKEYRAHRIIWILCNKEGIPEGMVIDHIDGNKQNNKIDNLRLATRRDNIANSIGRSKVGMPKGVQRISSGNYRAKIYYKGEHYGLGTYNTIEEASSAYNEAAEILYGDYAKK